MTFTIQISIIAAIISAFIAFVKLLSDNDGRISDFRKEWNESLRKSIAELNSSILGIYGRISIEHHNNHLNSYSLFLPSRKVLQKKNSIKNLKDDLFPYWKTLREAESLIYLHFNRAIPYENSFDDKFQSNESCREEINKLTKYIINPEKIKSDDLEKHEEEFINKLFCAIISTIKLIENKDYSKIADEKKYIYNGTKAINFFSSQILKITWEKVKRGEENTRKALKYTGVVLGVTIFISSLYIILIFELKIINIVHISS